MRCGVSIVLRSRKCTLNIFRNALTVRSPTHVLCKAPNLIFPLFITTFLPLLFKQVSVVLRYINPINAILELLPKGPLQGQIYDNKKQVFFPKFSKTKGVHLVIKIEKSKLPC